MLTPHRSAVSSRTYDQSQSLERHRVASHPNMASPFMLAPCPVGSLNHKDRFAGIPARFNLFAKCSRRCHVSSTPLFSKLRKGPPKKTYCQAVHYHRRDLRLWVGTADRARAGSDKNPHVQLLC